MPDLEKLTQILTKNGFTVARFATGAQAAAYIDRQIDGKTVGFGGSMTLKELGLYELLSAHNTVYSHAVQGPSAQPLAAAAQVYLTSVNGLAETGELINIDGHGKNAQRLGKKTPCALKGDRCYDCDSPERICRVVSTHLRKPTSIPVAHVVLVEEALGY